MIDLDNNSANPSEVLMYPSTLCVALRLCLVGFLHMLAWIVYCIGDIKSGDGEIDQSPNQTLLPLDINQGLFDMFWFGGFHRGLQN